MWARPGVRVLFTLSSMTEDQEHYGEDEKRGGEIKYVLYSLSSVDFTGRNHTYCNPTQSKNILK